MEWNFVFQGWQRGELVRVFEEGNATKVEALMIDFGDTIVVDIDNVRRLPKKFGRLPKMALPCKLQRILPLNGSSTFSGLANAYLLIGPCVTNFFLLRP